MKVVRSVSFDQESLDIIEKWREEKFLLTASENPDHRHFSIAVREVIKGYDRFRTIALNLQDQAKEREKRRLELVFGTPKIPDRTKESRQKSEKDTRDTKGRFTKKVK